MFDLKDILTSKLRIKFLFLIILLVFNGCYKDPVEEIIENNLKQLKPKTTKPLILAYGDSLTRGNDYKREDAYPHRLQERLDELECEYEVLNFGVNGETSEKAGNKLDIALELPNIEIVILELGANDIAKKVSASEVKKNLQSMIDSFKEKNIKVLLCGYEAPKENGIEYQKEVETMYAALAKENNLLLMPHFMVDVRNDSELMLKDKVHPNLKGIKIIEENVYAKLKPLLNCKK